MDYLPKARALPALLIGGAITLLILNAVIPAAQKRRWFGLGG